MSKKYMTKFSGKKTRTQFLDIVGYIAYVLHYFKSHIYVGNVLVMYIEKNRTRFLDIVSCQVVKMIGLFGKRAL